MSKITLYCHRKAYSNACSPFINGTFNSCSSFINGTYKYWLCQEKVNKCKYFDYRWQENEGGYIIGGMY